MKPNANNFCLLFSNFNAPFTFVSPLPSFKGARWMTRFVPMRVPG